MATHGLPLVWGATAREAERHYPADDAVPGPSVAMTRAIDVAAPVETTWRWLCQLSEAPYSYDWIDNLGRRSPRTLTPGAERVELGQAMATVLRVTSVDAPHQWTGTTTPRGQRLAGGFAMTYAAEPDGPHSRIVVRITAAASSPLTRLRAQALAWGDLPMIRKQLRTLKQLAESAAPRSS